MHVVVCVHTPQGVELYVFVLEHVSPICPRVQLAPENTMMSFNRSIDCGVMAFETDVQLRYSGFELFLRGS